MALPCHIGEFIEEARERLGLHDEFCARQRGLSWSCYHDVEADADEFFTNISLGTARRICKLLRLDLLDLTARFLPAEIAERSAVDDAEFFARNDLIGRRRRAKGMTEEELGDAIGYGAVTVEFLQRTPDFIESLPVNVVVDTARALDLDPGLLICSRT